MRLCRTAALFLSLVLAPTAVLQAQTTEIQEEVEIRLWFQGLLQKFGVRGASSMFLLFALAAGALALFGVMWLWKSRRRDDAEPLHGLKSQERAPSARDNGTSSIRG
jgi:hypothetical protein